MDTSPTMRSSTIRLLLALSFVLAAACGGGSGGADLAGADLAGADLAEADLGGADLAVADLSVTPPTDAGTCDPGSTIGCATPNCVFASYYANPNAPGLLRIDQTCSASCSTFVAGNGELAPAQDALHGPVCATSADCDTAGAKCCTLGCTSIKLCAVPTAPLLSGRSDVITCP